MATMKDYFLTSVEAKLLRAIGIAGGASYYQLASGVQLTPSKVQEVVVHLVDKKLAKTLPEGVTVDLTDEGRSAFNCLWQPSLGSKRAPVGKRVVIVPDRVLGVAAYGKSPVVNEETSVDAALDAAIEQMSREKVS